MMDDFKKRLARRRALLAVMALFPIGAVLLARLFFIDSTVSGFTSDYAAGFQMGITTGIFALAIFTAFKTYRATKNPEMLKRLYIAETDERKAFILQKSGSVGMNIIMYGLAVASAVSANLNQTVFYTLLSVLLFVALVRGFLKVYYLKKH